ncbi:hypothetical protein BC833DRAFT_612470 [Globomyces pollinis-pini]|nr:hypothetical protein BC833DRAFT_612470 [Globomyces pollinis-pini]
MNLGSGKIEIIGYDSAGALNGFHSLMSLVDVKNRNKLPSGTVQDCPRYSYRGVMVDVLIMLFNNN